MNTTCAHQGTEPHRSTCDPAFFRDPHWHTVIRDGEIVDPTYDIETDTEFYETILSRLQAWPDDDEITVVPSVPYDDDSEPDW